MPPSYIARRLASAILVILGVSTAVFFLSHLTGDPASLLLGPGASQAQVAAVNHQWGYDRPLIAQYGDFMRKAAEGHFGESLWQHEPALDLVARRFPATGLLTLSALAIAILVGVSLGIVAAAYHGTAWDRASVVLALLGQTMPVFWTGIMLIMLFAVRLHTLPASGMGGVRHLILPAVTLSTHSLGRLARLTRSQMLEVLNQDFVRTARAKGVRRLSILMRHAFRNAAGPLVTLLGIETGQLLGGAFVTEVVFAWPGLGQLLVTALFQRDFPLIQAGVLWTSLVFVVITVLVDFAYALINPRVTYR